MDVTPIAHEWVGWWSIEGNDEITPAMADVLGEEVKRARAKGLEIVVQDGLTLRWHPAPGSLDAAWNRAKAAMPTKRKPCLVLRQMPAESPSGGFCAQAQGIGIDVYAATEVEALRLLAERLEGMR